MHDQSQHQQVHGIKSAAGVLKSSAVVALPPAIAPDRHEHEQRKPLPADLEMRAAEVIKDVLCERRKSEYSKQHVLL